MFNIISSILLMSVILGGSGVAGSLRAVEILPPGEIAHLQYPGLIVSSSEPTRTTVDLDLGQSVEGYVVRLRCEPSCSERFRVQWQYETSLTVTDEGPHADLDDWKHFTSPWADVKPSASGKLILPTVSPSDSSKFPSVSMGEVVQAVRARFGERWVRLASQAKYPGDGPTLVVLSKYRVRVQVALGSELTSLYEFSFKVPMGC